MKLKFTITFESSEYSQEQLKEYFHADSIKEAAIHQQEWIDDGSTDMLELIDGADGITTVVEAIE